MITLVGVELAVAVAVTVTVSVRVAVDFAVDFGAMGVNGQPGGKNISAVSAVTPLHARSTSMTVCAPTVMLWFATAGHPREVDVSVRT